MEIFKQLKELGYKHYVDLTIEELDDLSTNDIEKRIEYSLAIDWFREKHNIHIIINGDNFDNYLSFDGYSLELLLTKWNNPSDNIVLFKDDNSREGFSYSKAREQAILKAIELCQKEK